MLAPTGLAARERDVRAEGFADYAGCPFGPRDLYSSIVSLERFTGRNLRTFGYDMYTEPVRRAAMRRARDTGLPARFGTVRLLQETDFDVQPGFLIYLPIYRSGLAHDTVPERRRALQRFVFSPFQARHLLAKILEDSGDDG